jgi:xyloglucan-specific exo-beta-1,4-glucanase
MRSRLAGLMAALLFASYASGASPEKREHAGVTTSVTAYRWSNVALGGGGYVTGLVAHPKERGLIYMRTDIGGAYRWDDAERNWIPLNDQFTDAALYSVDGIGLDAQQPDVVYISVGMGKLSKVLKSSNRGKSWSVAMSAPNGAFNGNATRRWHGEPIAVDPNNSDIIYVGTRKSGLYRTLDGGTTWQVVGAIPSGIDGIGIRSIRIDPRDLRDGRSGRIYVGILGSGIFVSEDGGSTFGHMDGSPDRPHRMVVDGASALLVTAQNGVFRYNGNWKNISPDRSAYNAIDVAPDAPNEIVAVVDQKTPGIDPHGLPIRYSRDGGTSWTDINARARVTYMAPWYGRSRFSAATSAVVFDPARPHRVWLADWFSTLRTDDIGATTVDWRQELRGHEEMVVLALAAPTAGAPVLSGVADNRGFQHLALNSYPVRSFPFGQEITGLDFCECDPNRIVQVGSKDWGAGGGFAAYSTDNGSSWRLVQSWPFGANGKVAVSATDPNLVVAVPQKSPPVRTTDLGASWQVSRGVPAGAISSIWERSIPIASDRVDGRSFYYLHPDGRFFASEDGGTTFIQKSSLAGAASNAVKAAPGIAGEVWVSLSDKGLFRSSSGGKEFAKLPNVQSARLFAFGRSPPGRMHPTVFVLGRVSGSPGIFRSDDMGVSWQKIDDDRQPIGDDPMVMEGDRQVFGRVYIGTNGRGLFVGAPADRGE